MTTYPNDESALKNARRMVESGLAACASTFQVKSIYVWRGEIEEADESIVLFKTTARLARRLINEVAKSHPYEVPEIVEFTPSFVNRSYLKWLVESVRMKRGTSGAR